MLFILSGLRLPEHLIDIYRNIFVYPRVNITPWELLLLQMNEDLSGEHLIHHNQATPPVGVK